MASTNVGPSNLTLLGNALVNTTVIGSMVASYVCPSDIYPAQQHPVVNGTTTGTGPYSMNNAMESNYLVSTADYTEYNCPGGNGAGLPNQYYQGVFFNDISVDIARIRDGTSNTFLQGESLQPPGHYSTLYGPYWGSGTHTSTHGRILPPTSTTAAACLPNGSSMIFYPTCNPASTTGPPCNAPYAWVFSSRHAGGVNMGMADGSVRFIKNSISIYTWWGLATIAGNEIISSDSY